MSEFLHVPDTVTTAVRETVTPYGVELFAAEYIGGLSAYKFTFRKGDRTRALQFAYNFQPIEVLIEITRVFNVSATVEQVETITAPPVEVAPPAPEKKRGKK